MRSASAGKSPPSPDPSTRAAAEGPAARAGSKAAGSNGARAEGDRGRAAGASGREKKGLG
eukprot:622498-Rhodomonas_salina.1